MPRTHSHALLILGLIASTLLVLGGCAGTGSDSGDDSVKSGWLDPMQSRSPIYTAVSPSASASRATLNGARVCCDSLSGLRFQPMVTKNSEFYEVNASSQAFNFDTGKSFVVGLSIPDELERATITLDAIAGATVFAPTVLILDRDFRVSRAIDADAFQYTPASFMEPQRLQGKFYLDRRRGGELAAEKYIVVFTTADSMNGSTQMLSEALLYARARGLANPGLPNPVAAHAATGVFRIAVSDLETAAASTTQYVSQRQSADRYVAGAAVAAPKAAPSQPVSAPKPPVKPKPAQSRTGGGSQAMLSETQAMYDNMIRESVSSGNMDRAWRLVQEAERAGSTSARQTFLQAVERQ